MAISDFLFPKKCLGCGRAGRYVCGECIKKVETPFLICPQCGRKSVDGMVHAKCLKPQSLDGAISLWKYQGVVRKAVLGLKYKFALEIAGELAAHTTNAIKNYTGFMPQEVVLVPIPLYWLRGNWRGFNQVEAVGKGIASSLGWKFASDLLIRKKSAKPQAELKGEQRKQNVRGIFAVNPKYQPLAISHQSFILFDDVWTTGSTLKEAAKVLKRAGINNLWALTLART